jgi:hypothetical protein
MMVWLSPLEAISMVLQFRQIATDVSIPFVSGVEVYSSPGFMHANVDANGVTNEDDDIGRDG